MAPPPTTPVIPTAPPATAVFSVDPLLYPLGIGEFDTETVGPAEKTIPPPVPCIEFDEPYVSTNCPAEFVDSETLA
jgi:hypothetical protein